MDIQKIYNKEKNLDLLYMSEFFSTLEAHEFYLTLAAELENHLAQSQIKMFGKMINEPRLTAWFGDPGKTYKYSGVSRKPLPWTPTLIVLKEKIENNTKFSGGEFNSALVNFYRDGKDSMSAHSDDEKELGEQPCIASLSFGGVRKFVMRTKADRKDKITLELSSGSLLVMQGKTQTFWTHEIPKTKKKVDPRVNITFRYIYK